MLSLEVVLTGRNLRNIVWRVQRHAREEALAGAKFIKISAHKILVSVRSGLVGTQFQNTNQVGKKALEITVQNIPRNASIIRTSIQRQSVQNTRDAVGQEQLVSVPQILDLTVITIRRLNVRNIKVVAGMVHPANVLSQQEVDIRLRLILLILIPLAPMIRQLNVLNSQGVLGLAQHVNVQKAQLEVRVQVKVHKKVAQPTQLRSVQPKGVAGLAQLVNASLNLFTERKL